MFVIALVSNLTIMSEIQIQTKIFLYYFNNFPGTRGLIFAVPNGGKRSSINGGQMKASGTVSGIPDLLIAIEGRIYGIEVKTETGVLSPAQKRIHEIWAKNGNPVYLVRSFEEGTEIIDNIFKKHGIAILKYKE